MSALAPLRIVIAEDAAIMRDGLTQTLTRRGHDVVAAVGDAAALLDAVAVAQARCRRHRCPHAAHPHR